MVMVVSWLLLLLRSLRKFCKDLRNCCELFPISFLAVTVIIMIATVLIAVHIAVLIAAVLIAVLVVLK